MKDIIKLWKKLGIQEVEFEFDCGGDSMGSTEIRIYTNKSNNETIENETISDFIDDEVYKHVDFYVNSDGHYSGESGIVYIHLDDDEESLTYYKCGRSNYNEMHTEKVDVLLSDEEVQFLNEFVSSFGGGMDVIFSVNYKKDFILTDKMQELIDSIENKVDEVASNHQPEIECGDSDDIEFSDWYRFTTNEDDISEPSIEIVDNKVSITLSVQYYLTIDSND